LHGRRTERWEETELNVPGGIPVFGSNNSAAGGGNRALFYCRVEDDQLVIREYGSRGIEGWHPERAQIEWTPEVWRVPLGFSDRA
jgi:hypothetical protein